MKTENMYLNRLLKLAKHLGKNHLNEVLYKKAKEYNSERAGCNIEHFHWALKELPKIAPTQWRFNDDGHPYLVSHPEHNSLIGAGIYFRLNSDELFHLFVPGYQEPLPPYVALGENANPSDIANNIYLFVELNEYQSDFNLFEDIIRLAVNTKREKKIVKKYKLKNAA